MWESHRQRRPSFKFTHNNGIFVYFIRYLQYNAVSAYLNVNCDETCLQSHRCAVLNLHYEQVDKCLNKNHSHHKHTTTHPNHHHSHVKIPKWVCCHIIPAAVNQAPYQKIGEYIKSETSQHLGHLIFTNLLLKIQVYISLFLVGFSLKVSLVVHSCF